MRVELAVAGVRDAAGADAVEERKLIGLAGGGDHVRGRRLHGVGVGVGREEDVAEADARSAGFSTAGFLKQSARWSRPTWRHSRLHSLRMAARSAGVSAFMSQGSSSARPPRANATMRSVTRPVREGRTRRRGVAAADTRSEPRLDALAPETERARVQPRRETLEADILVHEHAPSRVRRRRGGVEGGGVMTRTRHLDEKKDSNEISARDEFRGESRLSALHASRGATASIRRPKRALSRRLVRRGSVQKHLS